MHLHPELWQWPQWVAIVLMVVTTLTYILMHNKPMVNGHKEPLQYNGWAKAINFLIWYYILSQGGFFK